MQLVKLHSTMSGETTHHHTYLCSLQGLITIFDCNYKIALQALRNIGNQDTGKVMFENIH